MSGLGRAAALVTTVAGVAYPFAVLYAAKHGEGAALLVMAALAVFLGIARALRPGPVLPGESQAALGRRRLGAIAGPAALLGLVMLGRGLSLPKVALAWPIIVSLVFLWKFWSSLATMPIIERFARMQEPELSPAKVAHCRTFTQVWCVFFVWNAVVSGLLALFADLRAWTFYTGVLSYILIGALFSVEVLVRKARFGFSGDGLGDRIAARLITLWRTAFAR